MIPEKVFHQILGLGETWRVSRVDYVEKESKVLIRVEDTPALWATESCPHCAAKSVGGYDHAPERSWRHLNVCQLESEIVCSLPRGQCKECRKVYTVRAPWEGRSRGLTQEFEAFALTLMREMPVSKAGEILGETDQKLWRALFAHVDAAWKDLSWENVVWVGADEMNRKKGHNYLTVFVDLQARRARRWRKCAARKPDRMRRHASSWNEPVGCGARIQRAGRRGSKNAGRNCGTNRWSRGWRMPCAWNCKRRMRPGRWARRAAAFNPGVAGCGPRRRH